MTYKGGGDRTRRAKNRQFGPLVKEVVRLSGRSRSTVYAVLNGRIRSSPVSRVIAMVQAGLQPGNNGDGSRLR